MCNALFDAYESMVGLSPLVPVTLQIDGRTEQVSVEPWLTLLGLLREDLRLPVGPMGCKRSDCGQCDVVVDGENLHACLALAVMHDGATVRTRNANRLSPAAAQPARRQPAVA